MFCCAARNRLVCRQRNRPILPLITSGKMGKKALKEARQAIKTLIASTKPPSEQVRVPLPRVINIHFLQTVFVRCPVTVNSRLADIPLLRTLGITDKIHIPIYRDLTGDDSRFYELSLFRTQNDVPKVSAITRVDCNRR